MVRALLMGGQACVFYGAAQVSKDVDFLILADEANFIGLHAALDESAGRFASPCRASTRTCWQRGHAVHFRCAAPGVRGTADRCHDPTCEILPDFEVLWEARTVFADDDGSEVPSALRVPIWWMPRKPSAAKDWPVIEALVAIHYRENRGDAARRSGSTSGCAKPAPPELLIELAARFPAEAARLQPARPLLALARSGDLPELRAALDAEVRAEQDKDRRYWEPLKREMEAFRRAERE